jgi:hypothetical protein
LFVFLLPPNLNKTYFILDSLDSLNPFFSKTIAALSHTSRKLSSVPYSSKIDVVSLTILLSNFCLSSAFVDIRFNVSE